MAKINEIDITSLTFQEGSAPSTPASTKWKLYAKTDGLYFIDDAGTETGPFGTGGGGSVPDWVEKLAAPTSSHADDQEFTSTIGGTAVTPTGTATWTQSNGLLSVLATGQSSGDVAARLYSLTTPAAALTIETRVRALLNSTAYPMVGLCFTDGTATSSNAVAFILYRNGTSAQAEINSGTLTSMTTSSGLVGDALGSYPNAFNFYLRLTWVATNSFTFSFSIDGVTWTNFGYGNKSLTLTPTHMGVLASAYSSANDTLASFEYLRRS